MRKFLHHSTRVTPGSTSRGPWALLIAALCLFSSALCSLPSALCSAADEQANDQLVQMIAELVKDSDRDMRALGLQQVREEAPGEEATKKFTELLPSLPAEGQAGLLEALGDRQDAAALPAVLQSLQSDQETVRAAAIGALGALGGKAQAPILAQKAAEGSELEKAAARQSLIRLRGGDVNAEIQAAMAGDSSKKPGVRVALLGVLAARNARESLPLVFQDAEDADPAVRLAALRALRSLADENDTAAMVKLLKRSSDDAERRTAELALLTICSRGRLDKEGCADALVAGLADADAPSRVVLVDALARAGGEKALEAVAGRLDDKDGAVRDEAVRMLSSWPGTDEKSVAAVAPRLEKLARSDNLRHQVLAIRGLVRLSSQGSSEPDKPADLKMLAEAMTLAKRPQEKRLVLGTLGVSVSTAESLALVESALDDPQVADEAGLAAVLIAEKMAKGDRGKAKGVLEKVLKSAKSEPVRQRAQKILATL